MMIDQAGLRRARLALEKAVTDWITDPNVSLVALGWPERDGMLDASKLSVRIHVRKKYGEGTELEAAVAAGRTGGVIPRRIGGVLVDVPQGRYSLQQPYGGFGASIKLRSQRMDPMQGGISISDAYRHIYGTLGGLVVDNTDETKKLILSNWHVLAGNWYAQPGWPVLQPGRGDGGRVTDLVARLSRHAMFFNLDAAVARLTGDRDLVDRQFGLESVKGVARPQLGMNVIKSGRRTKITRGRVIEVEGIAKMPYAGVSRLIRSVITIVPREGPEVSAGGDSGSFWLREDTMEAVGLHFAGGNDPEEALAMDMQPILDVLNVKIPA